MTIEAWISLALASVGALVWLVRLEARINAATAEIARHEQHAEKVAMELAAAASKAEAALKADVAGLEGRIVTAASMHSETTLQLVRLQEQVKHLTALFERQFAPAPPRRRASPGNG
jgi:hypothetical protein